MPIFDQGYQHWEGRLSGQSTRWLAITRRGVAVAMGNRWTRLTVLFSLVPPIFLALFLVFWGLFEQKSSFLTPFMIFLENLPPELKDGPRGYRTTIWTLAFRQFFEVQLVFPMILTLLVGPDLISQDLRFNAIPLYLSRPVRRFEYFLGKLGVVTAYLGAVTIGPVLLAFAAGYAFSLDPRVVVDTGRVLAGSLAYAAIVTASAGLLMLAFSSLSRNSRYVAAMWLGFWFVSSIASGVLQTTVRADWCPLISYRTNLDRIRDALLDSEASWGRMTSLGQVSPRSLPMRPFQPPRRRRYRPDDDPQRRSVWAPRTYPWPWSAAVLAGLAVASLLVLTTRVRGLDRLR